MDAKERDMGTNYLETPCGIFIDTLRCDTCENLAINCNCEPDTCRYCNVVVAPAGVDDGDWTCDGCTETLALKDWDSRSADAQDRAVLRGMG